MKHCFLKALFLVAATSVLFSLSSCEKVDQQDETVSVYLTYTITTDNGEAMPGTKASSADVFDEFYQKIKSGDLVAPNYSFTFTEKTTGAVYIVDGTWAGKDMVTLRTGTYSVVGTSTAAGENIQDKCSLVFDDEITVDVNSTTIILKANYDCSLIIFSDASIAKLSNYNGNSSTDLFKLNNYIYAFIRTKLYADGKQDQAYLEGTHTNDTKFKIYTGSLNYEIGKYYVYNDINAAFNLEKMEEGGSESDGAVNLSANGTANCYIINKAGTYKFNGTVKGNSSESVGDPTTAEVIWETFNTSTKPTVGDIISSVSFSNGLVQFTSTGVKGNALIAVKNSNNEILWSWHIWVTDYDPSSDYDTYKGHESIKMMDRNLGAMSSEPGTTSIGLIYEWGRKDPFMGSTSLSSYSQFASTISFPDCKTSNSTIGTEKYAAANPTQYIIANSQNQDWLYTSNNNAWSAEKSKNDPCPKGWKVPAGGQNNVWSSFPSSISSSSGVTWNSTYKGINVSESLSSNPVWYPAQGYHGDSDTYYSGYWQVGSEGRYWTTSTLGNGSDYFVFKTSTIETYHTSSSTHFSRANGMPVRCCSE